MWRRAGRRHPEPQRLDAVEEELGRLRSVRGGGGEGPAEDEEKARQFARVRRAMLARRTLPGGARPAVLRGTGQRSCRAGPGEARGDGEVAGTPGAGAAQDHPRAGRCNRGVALASVLAEATVMASDSRDIERMLEEVEPPHVVAGVHRDCLREELLERMHRARTGREGARRAGTGRWIMRGYRSDSFGAAGVGLRAVVLMGVVAMGAGQAVQLVRKTFTIFLDPKCRQTEVRTPDGKTRFVGEYSATVIGSDDPNFTASDARHQFGLNHELILRAKATGKATVVKRQETDFGTVVTYRATLDDGRVVTWAGSPEDVMTPEQRTERQKQMVALLAASKSEFVRKFTTPDGVTMYSYRIRMPDGTSVHHGSIMPDHDPEKVKQHQQEIERARLSTRGPSSARWKH